METVHLRFFLLLCFGVQQSTSDILQRQKRNWIIDSFSIDEGYSGEFPYSLGRVQLDKNLNLFKIFGQGVEKEPKGILQIHENTGEITVLGPVDYEKFHTLKVTFQALNEKNMVIETQLGIEIQIVDSNDNPPKFDAEQYEVTVEESTIQGTDLIILQAYDHDTERNNGIFDLNIVSVNPEPQELEFYLTQDEGSPFGKISFKGCLDHETAEKYTIIVEAKDRGEELQLSSSCTVTINIEDGNNHLPIITGQTGPGRVKEREENVLVSRLQVTDKDSKGTAAWRAKYQIHGDKNQHFRISTDPDTNEGLLYVQKHLDYEDDPVKNITISVENEIPYHSCTVVSRSSSGLWEVVTGSGTPTEAETIGGSIFHVKVIVEDVNDSPIFDKSNTQVMLTENTDAGQHLSTFTARDPDVSSANTVVYIKGHDPADWVTVDPVTGALTTSTSVDRESAFVKDGVYNVTIYAVDDGKPPMTGTATLSIHIIDENDNTPTLSRNVIDMCQSDKATLANITVFDLDEEPFAGPFYFKLHGDVKGKWSVDRLQGYSVNLVRESSVPSGHFELLLEVSDHQHKGNIYNLSVTVCNCSNTQTPNCRFRKAAGAALGAAALGIIFFSLLLFTGMILLAILVTMKKPKLEIKDESIGQHLMQSNIEIPGTDCQLDFESLIKGSSKNLKEIKASQVSVQNTVPLTAAAVQQFHSQEAISRIRHQKRDYFLQGLTTDSVNEASQYRSEFKEQDRTHMNSKRWSMGASSTMRTRFKSGNSQHQSWMTAGKNCSDSVISAHWEFLLTHLNRKLCNLQASDADMIEDILHVYTEDQNNQTLFELEAISIPDISFDPDVDLNLTSAFRTLASICMPFESTLYKSSQVTEKLETASLIQNEIKSKAET